MLSSFQKRQQSYKKNICIFKYLIKSFKIVHVSIKMEKNIKKKNKIQYVLNATKFL